MKCCKDTERSFYWIRKEKFFGFDSVKNIVLMGVFGLEITGKLFSLEQKQV
jgi:hypothetical protein